ncbi:MAG: Transcriptional regulator, AcrR family [uncultured Frankineae bacterium]|uniref:Transcriptional regulator, AcrR family n=1 Tax=uncultured Frankineae bacterium TaxID=437475 RepID=A0A6J4LKT5_9ACTN|nr:MAG: Transcriptional regulator, AcrR family [uncultured Frankineae bacterium]
MVVSAQQDALRPRGGRPAVTTRAELEQVALELFARRGFEATTVDDIAAAAGIGRRTFFRYYASKNDVVWGEFEEGLAALRARLSGTDASRPLLDALCEAVLAFNRLDPDHAPWHRNRMALVLTVPALQAHSTLRYAAWREVVAEFVGGRLGQAPGDLLPQLVAHLCLGAALTAYEQWLSAPDADLQELLAASLRALDGRWAGVRDS